MKQNNPFDLGTPVPEGYKVTNAGTQDKESWEAPALDYEKIALSKAIRSILQRTIAEEVWYQDKGCEMQLSKGLNDVEVMLIDFIRSTREQAHKQGREEAIDSFCIMVKNELKQQKMDGFSLDGTDFDAVFASAKKMCSPTSKD